MVRKIGYAVLLALVLLLDVAPFTGRVDHVWWERLPAFEALFGFFGCLLIIFVSKGLGRLFIQKKEEDYYDA